MSALSLGPSTVSPTDRGLVTVTPLPVRYGYDQCARRTVTFGPQRMTNHDLTVNRVPVSVHVTFHEETPGAWTCSHRSSSVRRFNSEDRANVSSAARSKIYDALRELVPRLVETGTAGFQRALINHGAESTWAAKASTLRVCAGIADTYVTVHQLVASGGARLGPALQQPRRALLATAELCHNNKPKTSRCEITAEIRTSDTGVVVGYAVKNDANQHQLALVPVEQMVSIDEVAP